MFDGETAVKGKTKEKEREDDAGDELEHREGLLLFKLFCPPKVNFWILFQLLKHQVHDFFKTLGRGGFKAEGEVG